MIDFVDFDNSTIPIKISQPYVSSALGGEETKEGDYKLVYWGYWSSSNLLELMLDEIPFTSVVYQAFELPYP